MTSWDPVQLPDVANLTRFKQVVAKKPTALSLTPNTSDDFVYNDEYVNWVEAHKAPGQQVFYDLDNEPGLWGEPLPSNWQPGVPACPSCHPPIVGVPRVHKAERTAKSILTPTYAELRKDTIDNASAIKDVNPSAMVFGGVGYGWSDFTSLQGGMTTRPTQFCAHPNGNPPDGLEFYDYLLQQVHAAEVSQGRKLMDVLDMHWYPEATGVDKNGVSRRITFDPN